LVFDKAGIKIRERNISLQPQVHQKQEYSYNLYRLRLGWRYG